MKTGCRGFVAVVCLCAAHAAAADQDVDITAVPGSEGDDIIVVVTTQEADALIASIIAEIGKANAAVIGSLAGNDTITIDADLDAFSLVGTLIGSSPGKSESGATATGVAAGDGADLIDSAGSQTTSATSTALYADVLPVDDTFLPTGSQKADVSVKATAESIGIDAGAGDDTVTTNSELSSSASAITGGVAAGIQADFSSSVSTKAESVAESKSGGIRAGAGNDQVTNGGTIAANASAASGVIAVEINASDENDAERKIQGELEASARAKAESVGIDTDGASTESDSDVTGALPEDGLQVTVQWSETLESGSDTVTNTGGITSIANAISDSEAVAVSAAAKGSLKATVNAEASATSRGINSGAGDDGVSNSGSIVADADATSWVVGASISAGEAADADKAAKGKAETKTNATADAKAIGIDADGPATSSASTIDTILGRSGISTTYTTTETAATGADSVLNTGTIDVTSTTSAGSRVVTVQVDAEGTAESEADSTAKSAATGISAGGGNDAVDNGGAITAGADATANALAITFDQGGDKAESKANAKVTAEATATGIAADGGAVDIVTTRQLTIDAVGIVVEHSRQETTQHGDDSVLNSETVDAMATALAGAAGAAITIDGSAESEMTSKATATATAVDAGGGNDLVDNAGALTANAGATAGGLSIGFAQKEGEKAEAEVEVKATVEATASVTGLAGDSGKDVTTAYNLEIDLSGLEIAFLLDEAALAGDDQLFNTGTIAASATSLSGAAGVSITIDGASKAELESTAKSQAAGIDAGGGSDLVDSAGAVTATATSTAGALSIAFAQKPDKKENAGAEANATAESTATGIAGDSGAHEVSLVDGILGFDGRSVAASREVTANAGDDVIIADGPVTATATATSLTLAGSVAIDGAAEAEMKAKAETGAAGIVGGGGNDDITSGGLITANATSFAGGIAAAVGQQSSDGSQAKTKVSAETEAKAESAGIATDGGTGDSLESLEVAVDASGLTFDYEKTATAASGDDLLVNTGDVDSSASATTAAAAVAVTIKGGAKADVDAKAEATARGLDSGGGADSVENAGVLTTSATATAITANVSVSTEGSATSNVGFLSGGNEVQAEAVGISSAGSGHSTSTVITADISFTDFSVIGGFQKIEDGVSGDGNDLVQNSGALTTTSLATTLAADVGVTGDGTALTLGRAKAEAHAGGIESGNGDDRVENTGALTSYAESAAALANVAVTGKGLAVAGNSAWDGGTQAEASATGIDADSGKLETITVDFEASLGGAQVVYQTTEVAATGNDVVLNAGSISAQAISTAATASVAVSPKGMSAAVSTSSAEAETFGIKGGHGDDHIENSGFITSYADSLAATASVSVTTGSGVAVAADAVWDSGTKAEAKATGIAGDGGNLEETTRLAIGTEEMSHDKTEVVADGADTILNFGDMDVDAIARAASASVAVVASSGVAVATATSTAEASASAIDAGAGTGIDEVYNAGILNATADADAASASVSVVNTGAAVAADSVWDGGTGASARARGIDVGAGADTVENDGEAHATATAFAGSVAVAVTSTGFAGASATATGEANASAIDASAGIDSDTIINHGVLSATADADAASASVSFTSTGASFSLNAGTDAIARSRGIETGDGADQILSTGTVTASADALAADAAVGISMTGVAAAVATAKAETNATAIDAGGDGADDIVENGGELIVDSNAKAFSAAVTVTNTGGAVSASDVWDGGTTAEALARGIATGDGADSILNSGAIGLDSDAVTAAASVAVAITGVAGAISTSTANSDATAIDAGGDAGDDIIENSGELTVTSDAFAAAVSVAFTSAGVTLAGGSWDSGTTAEASARGIDAAAGSDDITNSGAIDVSAGSITGQVDVSVAVTGVAGTASSQGLSGSEAIGIDAGEDQFDDTVVNSGRVDATATSLGASVSVGVTTAGVAASWNGGTLGDARARGIATGDGADQVGNTAEVHATADAGTLSAAVTVAVTGVAGAVSTSDAVSDAVAIDTGEGTGDDLVVNSGDLYADSDAHAASAAVSVTMAGVAGSGGDSWDGGVRGEALAAGITAGDGADMLFNDGAIEADSLASATGAAIAFALEGVAVAITTASTDAAAVGIDAGAGDDYVESTNTITANSLSNANSLNVALTKFGVSAAGNNVWDGGTTALAHATGVAGGTGLDTVINSGNMDVDASSIVPSTSISFNVAGVAASVSTATAQAHAIAIDTGADDDEIDNSGHLEVESDAVAIGVNVALTGVGVGVALNSADGGTTGNATAAAIAAGDGDDLIINSGEIDVEAGVVAPSLTVGFGGIAAVASSTSTAGTDASGIDGGEGNDRIQNTGDVDVFSDATAVTVNVAVSGGAAGSIDNIWDGGTTGTAVADGLRGGGGDDVVTSSADALIGSHARATSASVGITVAGGFGISLSSSTSNAIAAGIETGTGSDLVDNASEINSTAEAIAASLSVTMSQSGVAAAGNSTWDGGTTGNADAFGIALGEDDDQASNTGAITASADAQALAAAVAATPLFGVALADAVSTANANATALAAGAGADVLVNEGTLTADADAEAYGLNVSFSAAGIAGAGLSTLLDHGTQSNAAATGASGGDGADGIRNAVGGSITLHANADTGSDAVALALAGVAAAGSNAIAHAAVSGLDGGAGGDTLINEGSIDGDAVAEAVGRSLSLGSFTGIADANSTGHAVLAGLAGGNGDDWVENAGSITLDADADAIGQSIGGTATGFALAAADADAIADGAALSGGAGADTILNSGSIAIGADAATVARSIAASAAGYSLSSANTNSTVTIAGLDGGDGNDTMINEEGATVAVSALASTNSGGAAITLFGAAEGQAATLPRAIATGFAGGAGDDGMLNAGELIVRSRTTSYAAGTGAALAGFAAGDTSVESETFANGLSGGDGSDMLFNTGSIRVGPDADSVGDTRFMSLLDSDGFAAGAAGSAVMESVSAARTVSTGLDGGADDDLLSNSGELTVVANALNRSTGSTLALFGSAGANSESGAITTATGLDGGAGSDTIESLGILDVSAESVLQKTGGSTNFTLAGTNSSDSGLLAATAAFGLAGGSGADTLLTEGTVSVSAVSSLDSNGGSTSIFGTADAAGSSGARTQATGIDGGADDDTIVNDATLDIDATSNLAMDGSSYGFAGTSAAGASLTATTSVDGILGGSGVDTILNTGHIDIDANSELSSVGGSDTTFGGSAAATESGARSTARGIGGGEDDDLIENAEDATIDVAAIADLTTNAVSYTFGGSSDSNVAMTGVASAVGLHGDAGSNELSNFGQIDVLASTSLVATGGSNTTVTAVGSGGTTGGHTRSTSTALGLAADAGDDRLTSTGTLSVHAIAQAETSNSANTDASLVSNSGAQAAATAVAAARGLSGGDGANVMTSSNSVTVRADSNAYALAYASGASISLAGNATSTADSDASSSAAGIEAGNGANQVFIAGLLDVTADADTAKTITISAPIQTFDGTGDPQTVEPIPTSVEETAEVELPPLADDGDYGNGDLIFWTQTVVDPDVPQNPPPRDDPNVGPDGAYYVAVRTPILDEDGVETGHTWAWVHMPVFIVERTTEVANFPSSAAAAGHGLNGSGTAVSDGSATATAWGVRVGDGDNRVENDGSIFVTADANANLRSTATGGTTGDASVTAIAEASAFAYGILAGDGTNLIQNGGTLDVEALVSATADAVADAGDGVCISFLFWTWCIAPGDTSRSSTATRTAAAAGIATGVGDDVILNEAGAEIVVRAVAAGGATLAAAGIVTGAGNDIVVNEGLVSATTILGGVVTAGVGIDTGSGNDQLTLGDASEVIGSVSLGDGDDTLTLAGSPLVHDGLLNHTDLPGGPGIDSLVLQGPGTLMSLATGFERALKTGSGTFSLGSLGSLESLEIDGGILALAGDYVFAPDGAYQTYIHSDGDRGQLFVVGDVVADGAIAVERRGDNYISDGTRYTVVEAGGGVSNAFTDVTLPESRPLLSYELEQTANTVDVVANAESFSTVTGHRLYQEVGENLDGLAGGATGDFAEQLGNLQGMASGFDRAFASLAPDSYEVLTSHTIVVGHETSQVLRQHLSNARAVRRGDRSSRLAYEPVMLAYLGEDLRVIGAGMPSGMLAQSGAARASASASRAGRGPRAQTWTSAFLSSGDYDFSEGFTEYDYDNHAFAIGADYLVGENTIAGFMASYADSGIDEVHAVAEADIETWTGGLYATHFRGALYLEGGLTYSTQSFANRRTLLIDTEERVAQSEHDGSALMLFAGAGREFDFGSWQAEPYGSLHYFNIDEDAFQETGADSLNLIFDSKSTDVLLGEIGARFVRLQPIRNGELDWHATLAYNHDFDLDDGSIAYAYQGEPGSLLQVGDRNATAGSAVIAAGVAYIRGRSTFALDYRGQFNSAYRNNMLALRLALAF